MKLQDFIRDNRKELDRAIATALRMESNPNPNDREREIWVLNNECLYCWARSEGVEI